jgi:hypothetical protein
VSDYIRDGLITTAIHHSAVQVHNFIDMPKRNLGFIMALLLTAQVGAFGQTSWRTVSSFQFNWDGQEHVEVVLEKPQPSSGDLSGDFTRIRIRVPGQKEFSLSNKDGWMKYDSEGASRPSKALTTQNTVPSGHVLALKVAKDRTALFLFGYAYGSSPGSLDVLELAEDRQPRVVLHQKEFGLTDVRDLDGDNVAEIVGYPCLSQEFGNGLLTYDPFNVYKLGEPFAATSTLSVQLSKTYNLKHYYGWAGAKCSEDVAVVLHPPTGGKPIVLSTKNAEKLTAGRP